MIFGTGIIGKIIEIFLVLCGGFLLFWIFTMLVIDPINKTFDNSSKTDDEKIKEVVDEYLMEYE